MATKVPAGLPATLEVTLDSPALFVGFQLLDDSGVSPVPVTGQAGQVNGIFPGLNFGGNSYRAKLPGLAGRWYLVQIAVYTDGTYTTVDTNEPQGSDSLYFEQPMGGNLAPALKCIVSRPVIKVKVGGGC